MEELKMQFLALLIGLLPIIEIMAIAIVVALIIRFITPKKP